MATEVPVIVVTYAVRRALIEALRVDARFIDTNTGHLIIVDRHGQAVLRFLAQNADAD